MSTEQAATAMPLNEGTAYRLIYYYEGDITELTPSERAWFGAYLKELHTPGVEVHDTPHTENLRRVEVIEDPVDNDNDGTTRIETTDEGIVTLDVVI